MYTFTFESLDLNAAEGHLVRAALETARTINGAARLLGLTVQTLRRRIARHRIAWPPKTEGA